MIMFFQAEDGIRDLVRSRGLGDVYKRQQHDRGIGALGQREAHPESPTSGRQVGCIQLDAICLLYTSDAADERSSVDLGGRRIIKNKKLRDDNEKVGNIKPIQVQHARMPRLIQGSQ